ncbi:MAG: [protein-PII] uridylyltransferase [Candidatus Velamenicoccus archaeovorus]
MTLRPAPVARLLDELRSLDRAYSPGHHGRWSAARRAELVDGCLRELFSDADPPDGVALVAQGGYGRSELAPRSDIDLLLLHPGSDPEAVAALAERVLYPLWDAGLTVGHAVRTPDECVQIASERLDVWTALLDGRPVAGRPGAWASLHTELVAAARVDPGAFVERLRADAHDRRQRHGSVSWLLEPELKEGAGGLRDVQSLGWLSVAAAEERGLGGLVGAGLLREAETASVEAAWDFLVRVRSALHLETGRGGDRLYLDQQPSIARAMGFEDEPGLRAVDGLMRAVFEHARQVEHVRRLAFGRFLRAGASGEVAQGRPVGVGWEVAHGLEPTPEGVLGVFEVMARSGVVLPASELDRIDGAELPDPVPWTEGVRDAFLRILREGERGVRALEAMDRIGLLVRLLPEWGPVRCRPQRDPYHRYTVDVHLLQALAGMARLLGGEAATEPMVPEAVSAVGDRDALLLGALLHDVGKVGEGSHVLVGVRMARSALDRMGVPEPTRGLTLFLVAEHLLLSDTATRRDLEDDDLVLDVAARIGTTDRLAALYLLTVADAGATGPAAWTPWRATLIRELVAKVQRVLERGEVGVETAERSTARADALRELLVGVEPGEVDRFLLRMPRSYLLTMPVEQIVEHHPLVSVPIGATEVRTLTRRGSRPGTYGLTAVAADRPGLLSLIAGALSLAGLSILTAQVFTTEDGLAVDVFEVEGVFEPEVGEERWREFRNVLRRAIEGRISLERRVEDKRRRYPPPRVETPIEVTVDNGASDFFTVIEVGAPDRIGLLFDVTRTLAELHLDVHLAKVATYAGRVIDAFYVRDGLGRKVEEPEQIEEVRRALAERAG